MFLAVIVIWFAATVVAGVLIDREMEGFKRELAANEDIHVNLFEYERGVFNGTLHYDLEYRIREGHSLSDVMAELTGETEPRLSIKGSMGVKHGPYVGGGEGFAFAMTKSEYPLPEEIRQYLPQYPETLPVIEAVTTMGFGGRVVSRFTGADYAGSVKGPGIDPEKNISMVLQNWAGTLRFTSKLDHFDMAAHAGTLSVAFEEAGTSYEYGLKDIHLDMDSTRRTDLLWTGDARLIVGESELNGNGVHVRINDFVTHHSSRFREDVFDNSLIIATGSIHVDDIVIKGLKLYMSVNNVDVEAYETFVRILDRDLRDPQRYATVEEIEAGAEAVKRFFAAGPSISIDALNFHIVDENDVAGHLKLFYPPSSPVNIHSPESMLPHIDMAAGITASTKALKELTWIYAAFESKKQEARYGTPLSDEKIDELARKSHLQMMIAFYFMPFFRVSEEVVESRLEIRDGVVFANGQRVMNVRELMEKWL